MKPDANKTTGLSRAEYISLIAALGGFLFGFDTAVISGILGPVTDDFSLDSMLEGWLVSSGLLGCIIGVIVIGVLSDALGRKKSLLLSGYIFLISAIGCAIANSFTLLIIFRLIGGIGVGMASVVSPLYISEIAPAEQRGKLVSYYQLAITLGIIGAYLSNALVLLIANTVPMPALYLTPDAQLWRPMFLVMMVPSLWFVGMLYKIPESPRWLLMKKKTGAALAALAKTRTALEAEHTFDRIKEAGQRTGQDGRLFKKALGLPLLVGIVLAVLQQFSGINAIIYYGPSIFESAGIASDNALVYQVIVGFVNLVFTFVTLRYIDRYGRKLLLKVGLSGIVISLFFSGLLFYFDKGDSWLLLAMILLFIACFAFSLGPITWVIINEIFPTEVRVKAVSLCTLALWIAVWVVGQFFPWLLQNVGAAITFWVFAVCSLLNFFFCWKIVKETKGKDLEETGTFYGNPH